MSVCVLAVLVYDFVGFLEDFGAGCGRIFLCVGHGRFSLSVWGLLGCCFLNFARGDFLHPFFFFSSFVCALLFRFLVLYFFLFFRSPCFLSCSLSNVARFIWLSVNGFSIILVPSALMMVTGPLRCAL